MLEALIWFDGTTVTVVATKVVLYSSTLLAAGSALVLIGLKTLDDSSRRTIRSVAIGSAIAALLASVGRVFAEAGFLAGETWGGVIEPRLLEIVVESPLGTSIKVRLAGLLLIGCLVFRGRIPTTIAAVGAVIACTSFALRGHALGEPRVVLGFLVTLHMMGLAFWIGALLPLHRMAGLDAAGAGTTAQEFGRRALCVVGLLFVAGLSTFAVLTDASIGAFSTLYGQVFAAKLGLFVVLIGVAAVNKLKLTPALLKKEVGAATILRRSIRAEAAIVAMILVATATLTTISTP